MTSIGNYAFANNQLESIVIPDGVAIIGDNAFSNNQLTSARMPGSAASIGSNAFSYNNLKSIEIPGGVTSISYQVFSWNELTSLVIPNGVEKIGEGAFMVNKLRSVDIPDSVDSIGISAFEENHLSEVTIPKSVSYIGDSAFSGNKLATSDIPDNIPVANEDIFSYNTPEFKSIDYITAQEAITTAELANPIALKKGDIKKLIIGSKKKDKITGTYYDEILAGKDGKDILTGKGGFDGFLFDTPNSMGKKHADVIKDFDSVEGDSILLGKGIFDIGNKVTLKTVTGKKQAKKASRGNNTFIYDDNKGLLYFNENGKAKGWGDDGGLFTKLIGAPELDASDLISV